MDDYLENFRYLPKASKKSSAELKDDIEAKLCETCIHYDFYFCKALQANSAPKRPCKSPELYSSKKLMGKIDNSVTIEE